VAPLRSVILATPSTPAIREKHCDGSSNGLPGGRFVIGKAGRGIYLETKPVVFCGSPQIQSGDRELRCCGKPPATILHTIREAACSDFDRVLAGITIIVGLTSHFGGENLIADDMDPVLNPCNVLLKLRWTRGDVGKPRNMLWS
jgi:hypothetical protein